MRETRTLEFKETISNTFLKTVSAFANYNGGVVLFGVDDSGNAKGLPNPKQACLDIENKINDNIFPQPDYRLDIVKDQIVKLTVDSGIQKPYLYKSKAYKRNDSATIEVDTYEFSRLVLEGKNITFEELPSKEQNLTFDTLKQKLEERMRLTAFNQDTLKTLNLYDDIHGYNNAAWLLADINNFPGVDIAKFGENINIIQKRTTLEHISILDIFDKTISTFKDNYVYEVIDGATRRTEEKIPLKAFREAVANALIHREWDMNAQIRVSMFDDHIDIISPGGLPLGINKDEYLFGRLSVLRNRNIANVFYRLGYVEVFGTGITRIKQLYSDSVTKPSFDISDNTIKITLPVLNQTIDLTEEETEVYNLLSKKLAKSTSEILPNVSFGKSKLLILLRNMATKDIVTIEGIGRSTKYRIK